MPTQTPLKEFHPAVRTWFDKAFGEPSPPQVIGWPSISAGQHTLILAPTGSGKTLASFLWAINHLVEQHLAEPLTPGVRILYVSPLKALNNDIERNLDAPLAGIRSEAEDLGLKLPKITKAVRTGDTPQSKRASMVKRPPDILITTPESLYLMLTSKQARKIFRTVQYVIVDEIHSICNNKRGVHLSLSLERLSEVAKQEFVRIGLSATQRPLDKIAAFLGGYSRQNDSFVPRPVNIIDAGRKKDMDLRVECSVPDFSNLPQESVWPHILADLLEHIRQHRTTLIFVNNRRLAERVAAKLNEMILGNENTFNLYAVPHTSISAKESVGDSIGMPAPDEEPVRAYHGSVSREARQAMEGDLKSGKLRVLVTTSSLELGIDIGSIDLVIQLQSPKGVARGLQRVGRSGHLVSATSKGRLFPSYREDLVESVVVARAMQQHDVEFTSIPSDCLDVLAQQIVAMVSVEDWDVEELLLLIRQSYCYRNLTDTLYTGVLNMLAGRYTDEAFRELRARISWDKVYNVLRALPGSSQLAITAGGTIADRGQFRVYLEDGKTKIGEVDEEFVYESRAGDTFILGSGVWRIGEIDANRLLVRPAPGEPARMPFWRGDGIGRSFELSKKVGEFRRMFGEKIDDEGSFEWLQQNYPIDSNSAWNIQEYFQKQQTSTGTIPHDRLIVVEGFRDEIGDPRIIIHSPFGRRINGLLGMVASRRLQEILGTEAQLLYNDDGILLRCSDVDVLPLDLLDGVSIPTAESIVLEELPTSALFGGQFRQNASRALLMPKLAPGRRTPLWLQRLRAGDLLQIVRKFDDFPIVIETMREVLNDVLDFENFKEVVRLIEAGEIKIQTIHTEVPSPFAASLLFDFISVYMYEWDQPRADRQSQYLSINRELLSEVVELESMPSLLRPEAVGEIADQMQHKANGSKARTPEELFQILLRLGDLDSTEIMERSVNGNLSLLNELASANRVLQTHFSTGSRWIAADDAELYKNRNEPKEATFLLSRYLSNHPPVSSAGIARRFDMGEAIVNEILQKLSSHSGIVRGRFLPQESDEPQWCYKQNLERIHRKTLSILRKEIKPSSLTEFANFLIHWQHLSPSRTLRSSSSTEECLRIMQGLPLPYDIWEREILARRIKDFSADSLREITARGEIVWAGCGQGKMRPILRGSGSIFLDLTDGANQTELAEPSQRILSFLSGNGASFFSDIRTGTGLSLAALNNGLAELFWSGRITNDVFDEILSIKRSANIESAGPIEPVQIIDPIHNPRRTAMLGRARRSLRQVPGWTGRWSRVHLDGVMGESLPIEERARLQALQLLDRYGIVARELVRRETLLPWSLIATELQRMELRGEIRRGYFVDGLSGMQFALPESVEEIRRLRTKTPDDVEPILVNACDPANPFGPGVDMPVQNPRQNMIRLARLSGNYTIFQSGVPILLIENYGTRLWTLAETNTEIMKAALLSLIRMAKLPPRVRPFKNIVVEQCDGIRATQSPFQPILSALGFHREKNQSMLYDDFV